MNELKQLAVRFGMLGAIATTGAGCEATKQAIFGEQTAEEVAEEKAHTYGYNLYNELDTLHLDEKERSIESIPQDVIDVSNAAWKEKATQALLEHQKWGANKGVAYQVLAEILDALTAQEIVILLEKQPAVSTGIPELLRNMFIYANKNTAMIHRIGETGSTSLYRQGSSMKRKEEDAIDIKEIRETQEKIALVLKELESKQ